MEEVIRLVTVKVRENSISMSGHANTVKYGRDPVCAAVSALTCNLVNSLEALTDIKIRAETERGRAEIEWDGTTKESCLLIDSWFLGLTAINEEYKCIEFI